MNELKPEDVMRELEYHAEERSVLRDALALLREKDATLEMCAETIKRQDKELAQKDAEIERLRMELKGETDGKSDL